MPRRHCERRPAQVVILSGELCFWPGEREGGKKVSSAHVWFCQLWLMLRWKEEKLAAMVHIWSRRSMPEQQTFTACSSGELFKATCNSVLARHFHVVSLEVVPWLCVHSEGGFKRLCVSLSLTYLHVRCANGSSPRRRRNVSPVVPDAYEYEMVTRTALTTVCV